MVTPTSNCVIVCIFIKMNVLLLKTYTYKDVSGREDIGTDSESCLVKGFGMLSLSLFIILHSLLSLGRFFSFLIICTVGMTPWTGDQPVARPLPTHRTTETQNKRTQDIHSSSGIRTHAHDLSVRAGEDDSCLRSRDRCNHSRFGISDVNLCNFIIEYLYNKGNLITTMEEED
jgi:hypothetical protein